MKQPLHHHSLLIPHPNYGIAFLLKKEYSKFNLKIVAFVT